MEQETRPTQAAIKAATRPKLEGSVYEQMVNERESLEEMVNLPGWRIFVRHVRDEWGTGTDGDGYRKRMHEAFTTDPQKSLTVHATSLEIEKLMLWPRSRVATLKADTGDVEE